MENPLNKESDEDDMNESFKMRSTTRSGETNSRIPEETERYEVSQKRAQTSQSSKEEVDERILHEEEYGKEFEEIVCTADSREGQSNEKQCEEIEVLEKTPKENAAIKKENAGNELMDIDLSDEDVQEMLLNTRTIKTRSCTKRKVQKAVELSVHASCKKTEKRPKNATNSNPKKVIEKNKYNDIVSFAKEKESAIQLSLSSESEDDQSDEDDTKEDGDSCIQSDSDGNEEIEYKDSHDIYNKKARKKIPTKPLLTKTHLAEKQEEYEKNIARLIRLDTQMFRQDMAPGQPEFCFGNNALALLGSKDTIIVLDMAFKTPNSILFPYLLSLIEIPQKAPYPNIYSKINFAKIYSNSSVMHRQELALEPFYVLGCSSPTIKARAVQVQWCPNNFTKDKCNLIVLTSFGTLQAYKLLSDFRSWKPTEFSLNKILSEKIYPMTDKEYSSITEYQKFKDVVSQLWVTNILSDPIRRTNIIYLTTDSGHIIGIKVNKEFQDGELYCQLKTSMGRISYAKLFHNFMVVGNSLGQVAVVKINHFNEPSFVEVAMLWAGEDRASLSVIDIQYCRELNSYIIVFSKTIHIVVCRLTKGGKLKSKRILDIGGVTITGIVAYKEDDFLVTTLTGKICRYKIKCLADDVIELEPKEVRHDLKLKKSVIVGITRTRHNNLFTLLLHRNRVHSHLSDNLNDAVYVVVVNIRPINYISMLNTIHSNNLEKYYDIFRGIHMNLHYFIDFEQYVNFYTLTNAVVPEIFDFEYQKSFQIKFLIVKIIKDIFTVKCYDTFFELPDYIHFYQRAIQIIHYLIRIPCVHGKFKNKTATSFGEMAANSMRARIFALIGELRRKMNRANHPFKSTVKAFIKSAEKQVAEFPKISSDKINEICIYCHEKVQIGATLCSNGHVVRRCVITSMQLPFYHNRNCEMCHSYVFEHFKIQDIYEPTEDIFCIYCRVRISKRNPEDVVEFVTDEPSKYSESTIEEITDEF